MLHSIKKNNKNYLQQGGILAIAGILVRIIGLFYRIPMNNIIGTVGNGYYTSAYNNYSLFLILSSYSFPTAISKLISTRLANDRYKDIKKLINCSLFLALIVGIIMFSFMYFGSGFIANILQKEKVKFALMALAPTLFIMSFLSVLRGIFQGMGNMVPTAISQIIEQIVNAVFSILFAFILFNRGKIANLIEETTDYEYAFGAAGGAIGTGLGALSALIVLVLLFIVLYRKLKRYFKTNNGYREESTFHIYYSILTTVIPIIISATIYNVSAVADDFIFSNAYNLLGKKEEIVLLLGVYGQYHLLFNIPVAVASALTSSIIPSISTSVATNNAKEVVLKVKYSLKFTFLIVVPAAIGLFVLADPICRLLFNYETVDLLIQLLKFGSIAVVTFSFSTITIGILHGLGKFNAPVFNAAIGLIIHLTLMFCLVFFLNFGVYSLIISNVMFSIIIFLLNQISIKRLVRYKKNYFRNYFLPLFSSVIMGIFTKIIYEAFDKNIIKSNTVFFLSIKVIITVFISLIIYIILLYLLRVINKRDAEYMPFLSRLVRK